MAKKKNSRAQSGPKATPQDAQIVLHLFDQRREAVMRKARNFVAFEFSPHNEEEFMATVMAMGTEPQTYWRMVSSYWEQAAALPNHGAVHAELFRDYSNELFFLYAKYGDFLPAIRKVFPTAWANIEKFVTATPERREQVARIRKMIAERFAPRSAKAAS